MVRAVKKKSVKTSKNVKKSSRSSESAGKIKRDSEKMEKIISSARHLETNKALTDNFIGLQKVMVNLSDRFDKLSVQIAKLLELFEISAKSLAKKDVESNAENKDTKKIMEKLDNLSQQAGLISKGLMLIHEMNSEEDSEGRHDEMHGDDDEKEEEDEDEDSGFYRKGTSEKMKLVPPHPESNERVMLSRVPSKTQSIGSRPMPNQNRQRQQPQQRPLQQHGSSSNQNLGSKTREIE